MVALTSVFSALTTLAGTLALNWSTDKEPVSYRPGEAMIFKIQLLEEGKPLAGKTLKWLRTGDDAKTTQGEAVSSETEAVEITTSLDQPGFVHLTVAVFNQDGSAVKDAREQPLKFEGGAGVEFAKLGGYPEPADFDAFWKAQKARLAAVPMKAKLTEVTRCNAYKPWCCDLGGIKLGRLRGWRPDYADGLGYYDTANMGKRVKCGTFLSAGLGDYVCPPSGVSILYNNIKGPKTIEYIQGSTHGYNPPNPKKQTLSAK